MNYTIVLKELQKNFPGHTFDIIPGERMPSLIMDGKKLPVVFNPDNTMMYTLDQIGKNNPNLSTSQVLIKYLISRMKAAGIK
jgi:predicted oxidoreductase